MELVRIGNMSAISRSIVKAAISCGGYGVLGRKWVCGTRTFMHLTCDFKKLE